MPNFSEIPWIVEHIRLYQTDPEKARHGDPPYADDQKNAAPRMIPAVVLDPI